MDFDRLLERGGVRAGGILMWMCWVYLAGATTYQAATRADLGSTFFLLQAGSTSAVAAAFLFLFCLLLVGKGKYKKWKGAALFVGLVAMLVGVTTHYAWIAGWLIRFSNPVSINGAVLSIRGSIPPNLADDIRAACGGSNCRSIQRLELESGGGYLVGAFEASKLIAEYKIPESRAIGQCASACVWLWAAAPVSTIAPGASLGIHGSYDAQSHQTNEAMRKMDLFLGHRLELKGLPSEVVNIALTYPPNRVYYIVANDLLQWRSASNR